MEDVRQIIWVGGTQEPDELEGPDGVGFQARGGMLLRILCERDVKICEARGAGEPWFSRLWENVATKYARAEHRSERA